MQNLTLAQIQSVIAGLSVPNRIFTDRCYTAKDTAQANLDGLTHYYSDSSLRSHKSKILSARIECEGLLLVTVESVAIDYENTKRGFRFVAFDVFGRVIAKDDLDNAKKTKDLAVKAAKDWLGSFDVSAYYMAKLSEIQKRLARDVVDIETVLN